MKTYQEYDSEIQGCDNLIKMLEKTIEEIKTKQWKLKEARRKAYEVVHPHVGRHKSGVEYTTKIGDKDLTKLNNCANLGFHL